MNVDIVLVEDTPDILQNLTEILVMENYSFKVAGHGKEALQVLADHEASLIITDLVMPEMDGLTLVREVRKLHAWKNIPIIILSAKIDPATQEEGLQAGATCFLKKPCDVDLLLTTIANLLKRV